MSAQLALLKKLVEIHSGTANVAGVERVQEVLKPALSEMGFRCRMERNPDPSLKSARMLIGELSASRSTLGCRFITLVTHADTVEPGVREGTEFRVSKDGKRAFGVGVIDDKGGQVVAIEGLRRFIADGALSRGLGIRFISAPSEETGSPGFQDRLRELSKDTVLVLGFEPSLDNGSIVDARNGNRWYQVEVEGREAHSGRAHDHGCNAAHELSIKLARLHELTDYKRGVTVSAGSISGGRGKFNIVCGHAEAKIDTRFPDLASGARLGIAVERELKRTHVRSKIGKIPTRTRWTIADDCPAFSPHAGARPFRDEYLRIIGSVEGRKPGSARAGGGADSCYMSRPGLTILDGLGPTGGLMHTPDEWLEVSTLETRAEACARFLRYAIEHGLTRDGSRTRPRKKPRKKT